MTVRFLPAALVAVFIALVAVGGAAFAFGLGGSDGETTDDLLERAASELGVESQVLKDALSQAQSGITLERQQELLTQLVDDDVITQEQADEASIWLDQQPAALNGLMRPELLLSLVVSSSQAVVVGSSKSVRRSSIFSKRAYSFRTCDTRLLVLEATSGWSRAHWIQ